MVLCLHAFFDKLPFFSLSCLLSVAHQSQVQGMQHNLFFFNHYHPENGVGDADDARSKFNDFEVLLLFIMIQKEEMKNR